MPTLEDLDAPVAPSAAPQEGSLAELSDEDIQAGIGAAEQHANVQGGISPTGSAPVTGGPSGGASPIGGGSQGSISKITSAVKNTKRIKRILIVAGPIVAVIGVVGPILFFLMLFKSVHIKHLFIDYQFAKFNRAFTRSLDKAVKEAKTNGEVKNVPADADPVTQLEGVDPAKINELKNNPEALAEEASAGEALNKANVGPDSPGAAVDEEFGISRDVAPPDPKLSPQEAEKASAKEIDTEVEGKGNDVKAPGPIEDAVNKAKEDAAAGKPKAEIEANAVKNVNSKLGGISGKASAGLFIATFGCIAQDIYSSSIKLFSKIKLAALARLAASVAKHADCQQVGACGLASAGAVSKKFDSGGQSYTQSAGYQRATGKTVTAAGTDKDLDQSMEPTSNGSGLTGELLNLANKISGTFHTPCSVILNPIFQVSATVTLIGAQIVLIVSGVVDFGLSDVVEAVAVGGATFLASKIGAALAVDAVMHYSGLIFHGPFTPIAMGNMMDAGSKVLASSTGMKTGGRELSATENQVLQTSIYKDQIDYARKQGLAYQLLSPENPYSVAGLAVDQVPSTVGSAITQFNTALATCFNPARFITSLARIGFSSPAYAAAHTESNTYGMPDIGIPDNIIDKWSIADNTAWVKSNILGSPDVKDKYDKCFNTALADKITSSDLDYCNNPNDVTLQHYMAYYIERAATHSVVYLGNTASNSGTSGGGGNGGGDTSTPASSCGTSQECAKKILQSNRISYSYPSTKKDMEDTSNNIPISICGNSIELNATMMSVLLTASEKYELRITVFATGHHCTNSPHAHATGRAFDVDSINGKDSSMSASPQNLPLDREFMEYVATILPDGSDIGQKQCVGSISVPKTINLFDDACTHVHVDIGDTAP